MMDIKQYFEKHFSMDNEAAAYDIERAQFIVSRIPPCAETVLEVGCGDGLVTNFIAKTYKVVGLELSKAGVDKVKALGLACVQGNVASLPFGNKAFDVVLASEVLEHLDEELYQAALLEIHRVAKKYIIITVPNKERFQSLRQECPKCRSVIVPWTHIRSFSLKQLPGPFSDFECKQALLFGPLVADHNRFITKLLHLHRRWNNFLKAGEICPICKHASTIVTHKRPGPYVFLRKPVSSMLYSLDWLAYKISPKSPRWIFALYQRI